MLTTLARAEERPFMLEYTHFTAAARALLCLEAGGCRWPIGDPAAESFRFCAAQRQHRASYCASHLGFARGPAR